LRNQRPSAFARGSILARPDSRSSAVSKKADNQFSKNASNFAESLFITEDPFVEKLSIQLNRTARSLFE
jgi:hypothetical protein